MHRSDVPVVIHTLVDQLGGPRVFAMAFRHMVYDVRDDDRTGVAASATFAIARSLVRDVPGRGTHVVVRLMSDDTYEVLLHRAPMTRQVLRGDPGRDVARVRDVHADRLREVIEGVTGLRLALGTMTRARISEVSP